MMILLTERCRREKCGGTFCIDGDGEKECLLCSRKPEEGMPRWLEVTLRGKKKAYEGESFKG